MKMGQSQQFKMFGLLAAYLLTHSSALAAVPERSANEYSVGVEGFYDRYQLPGLFNVNTTYGSVTGNYTHYGEHMFGALDGRASYGEGDFRSASIGNVNDLTQWEYEVRARAGAIFTVADGTLLPYSGIGMRYHIDDEKGSVSTLGSPGYDRRFTQYYIPIGATYSYKTQNGWLFMPNIEYDYLLYGHIDSRFINIGGTENETNHQKSGHGWRAEFMVGRQQERYSWQVGPFFRYWNIRNSDVKGAFSVSEPANERFQLGIAVRVKW